MKRVTILVDDIDEPDYDGERRLTGARSEHFDDTWVAADRILSVEDHVEPLPTEPGTRFWARLDADEPQWWFVRGVEDGDGFYYLPARGAAVHTDDADADRRRGLVRLPDPKPTDGDAR